MRYCFLKRFSLIVLASSILLAIGTPPKANAAELNLPDESYKYFNAAMSLYKKGQLEDAVMILRYLHEQNPQDDYLNENLKRINDELTMGQKEFEIESKKTAAILKKNKVNALIDDGDDYFLEKDYDDALVSFTDALALDPTNIKALAHMEALKEIYVTKISIEHLVQEGSSLPATNKQLSDDEINAIVRKKHAQKILAQAEMEIRIKNIIERKKKEEEREKQITVGPGDKLRIGVVDHPELSGYATIQANGRIVLPLINNTIYAQGLTLDELASVVQKVLDNYIRNPWVNISIMEYKSKIFYVIDEVGSRAFPFTKGELTLRDALFISNWGNDRALGRVSVISPSLSTPHIQTVNAYDLIFKGKLQNDIPIKQNDVIYIPLTRMAKTAKTITDTISPFSAVREARDEYLNLKWNAEDWKNLGNMPKNSTDESFTATNTSNYNYTVPTNDSLSTSNPGISKSNSSE